MPAVSLRHDPSFGRTRPTGLQNATSQDNSRRRDEVYRKSAGREQPRSTPKDRWKEKPEEIKRDPFGQPFMLDPVFAPTVRKETQIDAQAEAQGANRPVKRAQRQRRVEGYSHTITRAGHRVQVKGLRTSQSSSRRPQTTPVVDATPLLPYSVRTFKERGY